MKRLIAIVIFSISINLSHAQKDEFSAFYTSGELNMGNYIGIDINFNYIYKEKYSFKIGYTGNIRTPNSKPENYRNGFIGLLSLGLTYPYDQLENYQITLGKIYNLNNMGTIRLNLALGLGYTTIREPENWEIINGSVFTENYTWNYKAHHTLSVIINPKIEFPFTRYIGLTISPLLQINKDRTYIGIGLGSIMGVLRKKKLPKNNIKPE